MTRSRSPHPCFIRSATISCTSVTVNSKDEIPAACFSNCSFRMYSEAFRRSSANLFAAWNGCMMVHVSKHTSAHVSQHTSAWSQQGTVSRGYRWGAAHQQSTPCSVLERMWIARLVCAFTSNCLSRGNRWKRGPAAMDDITVSSAASACTDAPSLDAAVASASAAAADSGVSVRAFDV